MSTPRRTPSDLEMTSPRTFCHSAFATGEEQSVRPWSRPVSGRARSHRIFRRSPRSVELMARIASTELHKNREHAEPLAQNVLGMYRQCSPRGTCPIRDKWSKAYPYGASGAKETGFQTTGDRVQIRTHGVRIWEESLTGKMNTDWGSLSRTDSASPLVCHAGRVELLAEGTGHHAR